MLSPVGVEGFLPSTKAKPFPLGRHTTGPLHASSVCKALAAATFHGSQAPCPALPCPASSPGGSSRHLGQPMEKRSPCPAQGKALDIIGQKTTFGKETRQKEWEQARKRLPSSAWQEVPSPALAMGCHRDWESSGMLTPAQKLPVQPREEHFKTTNCTWKEHWQGAGKKHAPPSWRSTRSFL